MAFTPFERRRRRAARTALYLSLAVTAGLLWLLLGYLDRSRGLAAEVVWSKVDYEALPEVDLLRRYVRIDTTPTTGNEVDGALFLARELEAAGVPYHLERLGDGHANLWAILEGKSREAVVLHHHIDVEPIHQRDAWRHEPFGAEIDLPWVYGRGTFDMKSVAVAQLMAFVDVATSGRPLERSVILLASSSEETGSDLGTRHILADHPELVERFWGVLTEGGWIEMRSLHDLKYWGVEFAQKRFVDRIYRSQSRQQLESLYRRIRDNGLPPRAERVPEAVAEFLEVYAPTRDHPKLVELLSEPERLRGDPERFAELPGYLQSMFRNEVVAFRPVSDPEGGFRMTVKLHLLPGASPEDVARELLPPEWTRGLAEIRPEPDPPHRASPLEHPVFRAAVEVLEESHPDVVAGPLFLPWTATDSRFFRAAGIPSYGFSPFTIFTSDTIHVSGPNERIALPGYVEGVRLYEVLLHRLVFGALRSGEGELSDTGRSPR